MAGQPAVLSLGADERYSYEKTGLDINLEAFHSGQTLILQESVSDRAAGERRARACLRLTPGARGWAGTWTKAGTKVGMPVTLSRLHAAAIPFALPVTPGLQKLRRDDPYSFLKINHAWNRTSDGTSVREPRSGLTYPRLPGESAALNGALQDRQAMHAIAALECRSGGDWSGMDTDYSLDQGPRFLSAKLLSFLDTADFYCGGAHPNISQQGVILDRLTGEALRPDDIWPLLTPGEQHRLYLGSLPAGPGAECRDLLGSRGQPAYTVSLLRGGLQLIPTDLPHVAQACAEPVVVGYAKLRDLSFQGQPYFSEFYKP
ncbi:hypothetical protein CVO96_03100 [Deinococcus koreensis]|uniref:Uncharacterized protein n=1 Tax=Deinococcus koreensis TaxID=2054903 RepID=A0A2K3UVC3_9DEIO|nr:hypothetical protein CVO96_03100 [Deinococcus koreensis]